MGRFTKIPSDAFDKLQLDAGVLLKTFDPSNPQIATNVIICATTGGINVSCVPSYSDFAEDVDNAPDVYLWIKRGVPFAQRMSDEDPAVRRIYMNVEVEFFTNK